VWSTGSIRAGSLFFGALTRVLTCIRDHALLRVCLQGRFRIRRGTREPLFAIFLREQRAAPACGTDAHRCCGCGA
jgi:hypothetical protein